MSGLAPDIGKDFPKRKAGRPRLLSTTVEDLLKREVLRNMPVTRRTLQNSAHMMDAIPTLSDNGGVARFPWLMRPDFAGIASFRKSIMYELGKIAPDDVLLFFADELERRKPTATTAIRLLRAWRKGMKSLTDDNP